MIEVNLYDAKTHLSKLVDQAAQGETITIAKAGQPRAKLTRVDSPPHPQRLGFLEGKATIPDDFDQMASAEIETLFHGAP